MKIDRIVVFCSPKDVSLTELCVASIRFWNMTIPLFLHKDESRGKFSTTHLEENFNVRLCDSSNSSCGNPMSKFYYVTQGADTIEDEGLLIMDSDTAWFGDVAQKFDDIPDEMQLVVQGEMNPSREWLKRKYFNPDFFESRNPNLKLPEFAFNSGHFLVKAGAFSFDESEGLLNENQNDTIEPLFLYDQGLFNYIHAKRRAEGSITSASLEFAKWPGHKLNFDNIVNQPFLVHWAGLTHPLEERMAYWERLKVYRKFFLEMNGIRGSGLLHRAKRLAAFTLHYLKQLRLLLLGKWKYMRL